MSSKKAEEVVILDVSELSSVTGFFVIATANNAPHIKALTGEMDVQLKKEGQRCYRLAGSPESGWMVMDYLDVVVHIFSPQMREYYALERLWSDAPHLEGETA